MTKKTEQMPAGERVRIKLFKDSGRYSGDVFVGVNGRSYLLKRGVELQVPAEVAEVLEHSQVQDSLTAQRIAQAEQAAAQPAAALG